MRSFFARPLVLAGLAAAWVHAVHAQAPALTAADYARAERFLGATTAPLVSGGAVRPNWLDDGRFWYRTTTAGGPRVRVVDPARRTRGAAFDHARLAQALAAAAGDRVSGDSLPALELSRDGRRLTATVGRRRWTCELEVYQCAAADTLAPGTPPPNSVTAPDGASAVFIRDYNLWIRDLASGRDTPLTTDGVREFGYATDNAGWRKSDRPIVLWSPDSKKIASFQMDERGTSSMYLVTTTVGQPTLQAWKYPLPGDSVIFRIERVVIDVAARRVVRLQMPPDQHRSTQCDDVTCGGGVPADLEWYPDGSAFAFVSTSRDHKDEYVRVADATTGAVRTVFEEHVQTQYESGQDGINWRVLPGSNEVIWFSERENWGHLYLYDLATGALKRRITDGEGNVTDILKVDPQSRTIWFTAVGKEPGRDPYFRQLYRMRLDGSRRTLLTPENADHAVALSPDGRYFIDVYSTPDTPPVSLLRDLTGNVVLTLERADISRLLATGWKPPTPITVKARDGSTDLYGLLYTPAALDSTRRYPIINHVYPGPQTGSVGGRQFSPARGDNQALAELGFVVVEIDGMGTPWRSKAFHDAYYGRMGDNTLPDQVAGMQELARRYPWIDLDRAGIWGHSGGGFAAADAMFRYPAFFKVGIAESGNHDNRNYEDDWGERYQGLLIRSAGGDNYAAEANQTLAANLKGRLLLAHGTLDDNVPPYNTDVVVEALIRANKDFDLLMLPNQRHGYGAMGNYMMRRRWDYFVRHLLGAEPPREYEIGRARGAPAPAIP